MANDTVPHSQQLSAPHVWRARGPDSGFVRRILVRAHCSAALLGASRAAKRSVVSSVARKCRGRTSFHPSWKPPPKHYPCPVPRGGLFSCSGGG